MGDMAKEIQLAIDDISDASSQRAVDLLLKFVKQVQLKLLTKIEAEVEMAVDGLERKLRAEPVQEPKTPLGLGVQPKLIVEPKDDPPPRVFLDRRQTKDPEPSPSFLVSTSGAGSTQRGKQLRHGHTSPQPESCPPTEPSRAVSKNCADSPPWAQLSSGTSTRVMFAAAHDGEPAEGSQSIATDGHAKTATVSAGATHNALAALSPSSQARAASSATMAVLPAWASAISQPKSGVARVTRSSLSHAATSESALGTTHKSTTAVDPSVKPASLPNAVAPALSQTAAPASAPDASFVTSPSAGGDSTVSFSKAATPSTAHLPTAAAGRPSAPVRPPAAPLVAAPTAEICAPAALTCAPASESAFQQSAKLTSAPAATPVSKRPAQVAGPEGSTWRCHPVRACSGPEVAVHTAVGRETVT